MAPAFVLNLSSVLFASAAPAATSDGALTLADTAGDGAFTLRYSADDLGYALYTDDKSTINLRNVPEGTYLVAQNSEGAYAKRITDEEEVTAAVLKTARYGWNGRMKKRELRMRQRRNMV